MSSRNRIHVAGVIDLAEAEMLIECGISNLGFPLALDYHDEDLSVEEAADIVARLGEKATFFVITYLAEVDAILDLCRQVGVTTVQLHGAIDDGELRLLRDKAANFQIIKSLVVGLNDEAALASEIERKAFYVDAFITDTFDAKTGAEGATGKVHDWSISRRLVQASPKPVVLAGGLTPTNVANAIEIVQPAGVDVHTGIEGTDGRKRGDETKAFVAAAQHAFSRLG